MNRIISKIKQIVAPNSYLFAFHKEHVKVNLVSRKNWFFTRVVDVEVTCVEHKLDEWFAENMEGRYFMTFKNLATDSGGLVDRFSKSKYFEKYKYNDMYGIQIDRHRTELDFLLIRINKRDDAIKFRLTFSDAIIVE